MSSGHDWRRESPDPATDLAADRAPASATAPVTAPVPGGFARLFAWCMFVALPLWQAVMAGGLVWYWRVTAKGILDPAIRQVEGFHVAYQFAVAASVAVCSFMGGWRLISGDRRGIAPGSAAFFILLADALLHNLLVYLLPYPPNVKSDILAIMGGLASPELFARAALYGSCLGYLLLSRQFGRLPRKSGGRA